MTRAKYFILTCIVIILDLIFGTLGWIYEICASSFWAGRVVATKFQDDLDEVICSSDTQQIKGL